MPKSLAARKFLTMARRFNARKSMVKGRTTFRKRSTKRTRGFANRRTKSVSFKRRRPVIKRAAFAKKIVQTLGGDQVLVDSYVDNIQLTNTTNLVANNVIWAENNIATPNRATTLIRNLCLDDRFHLGLMFSATQALEYNDTTGVVQEGRNRKIIRKSCEFSARIVNAETSNVCIWEYRCVARRDQTSSVLSILGSQTNVMNSMRAAAATPASTTPFPTNTAGSLSSSVLGTTPYMWPDFVARFRIKKVKKRELAPGKVWKIKYSQKKPRIFDWSNLNSTPTTAPAFNQNSPWTGTYILRKGQAFSLFMAQGTWATNNGANANFKVGVSNVNIGIEYQYKAHYGIMEISPNNASTYSSTPGFSSVVANAPLPLISVNPIRTITVATGAVTYANNNASGATSVPDADQMDV